MVYAGIVLAVVAALVAVRWSGAARSLAYWPSREPFETPDGYEDVAFTTDDGVRLHGWFMPAEGGGEGPAPTVIHLHGNAGHIWYHEPFSDYLLPRGMNVLLFDYRCYGRSDEQGPVRREGLMLDALASLEYLLTREDVDADRIGALGMSLGSAFALELASRREEVRSVATIGAFSTWKGAASDAIPLLGPFLFPGGMDPIDALEGLGERPYLIVHGTRDGVIEHRHAEILRARCEALGVDATLRSVRGGDHVRILEEHPEVEEEIADFFARTLGVE